MNPVVIIPSRLAATRLPNKPLADIAGRPMIVHVVERALEADIGPVAVAADAVEIAEVLQGSGARVILTRPDHPSGSDRIFEALAALSDGAYDVIVNVQGDLPTISPAAIASSLTPLRDAAVDIATLAAEITEQHEKTDPNVVKLVGSPLGVDGRLRALYFTRATAPWGEGPLFHHIGLYAYRRAALERFVGLPPSALEKREKLEQLRALEAGMRIDAVLVDDVPLGVDTPADLERANNILGSKRPDRIGH